MNTNHIANAIDRRILPTPSSGLGIGGGSGRGNTFMIDGLDNLYNSGSVRSSISQDAVQEFQVNRNSFSTEQGGAPGGTINIVTKGGTNDFYGTLFGGLRNRRFQARNYFDPEKSPCTRAQSGVSIGGPIKPNKTFFHLAADFTLSGIVAANSFAPFNLTTGFDSLGDRHTDTHRPWGLGRNAGKGPDFFSVDMRLTRTIPLSETVNLQVIGEAFNLLNRTNFKTVNGVVGNASIEDLPANLVGRRGPVTEPLSFASAMRICSGVSARGRPMATPRLWAAARPARVRSRIMSRSNSASAAKM